MVCVRHTWEWEIMMSSQSVALSGSARIEKNISENALRGSGGAGFFISDKLLMDYNSDVIDDTYEGILWIKLSLKHDPEISVLLCVCHLPPEGSSRGNQVQEFYETLLAQVYLHCDGSPTLTCGDFNGRIGTKQDSSDETISPRIAIDAVHRNHGEHLLQFLSDTRFWAFRYSTRQLH